MAIDQGTTGSTVSLVDHAGGLVAQASQDFRQIFPQPGWVEHNPEDIWKSVKECISKVLKTAGASGDQVAAIGITNQRETVAVWERKTNKPVYNAIVWQCRRTTDFCQQLVRKKKHREIQEKTGLVTDPYFSASKIRWILQNDRSLTVPAKNGDLAMGTMDTFLVWKLSGGKSHITDVSNASRTMLMNINKMQWDQDLLKLFQVPETLLPHITDSSGVLAETMGLDVLPDHIPITGIAGDQQAALFGQICFGVGDLKCTFGTGSFILVNTGSVRIKSKQRLLSTVAWRLNGEKPVYALEGSVFVSGAAVQWLRDGLGIINSSHEVEQLARSVEDCGGISFVPALTGLGAPYWSAEARGIISGLTRGTSRAHIARATLEAMALQNVDLMDSMAKDLGKKIKSVKVDGGASANDLLMQMQTDFSGINVSRPQNVESTSMGAAYLAGIGVGFWKSQKELSQVWKLDKDFQPEMSLNARKDKLNEWHLNIKRTLITGH